MKIAVAVLFGGKSVEHEVSIISGVQAMAALDETAYEVIPVYITKGNEFYTGDVLKDVAAYQDIPATLKVASRATFEVDGTKTYLISGEFGLFKKPTRQLIDVVMPVVHGTNVEDGALQGFLETLNLPYTGPNVLSSAVCMDKYVMKVMLQHGGFPVLPGLRFQVSDANLVEKVEAAFPYPVIVKPANLGSSIGIGKANDANELRDCAETAFSFARYVLIEPAVVDLREINCAVLGDASGAEASECEEPVMHDAILSYQDKYGGGGKTGGKAATAGGAKGQGSQSGAKGMASLQRQIPAPITDEQREHIRTLAVDAFRYLDCDGVARIDFLMDAGTEEIWINELNTIPGSLAFYLWEAIGLPYSKLLDKMIALALKRAREADDLTYAFDTNILANASLGGAKGAKN